MNTEKLITAIFEDTNLLGVLPPHLSGKISSGLLEGDRTVGQVLGLVNQKLESLPSLQEGLDVGHHDVLDLVDLVSDALHFVDVGRHLSSAS